MADKKPGPCPRPAAAAPDQTKVTTMQAQRLAAISAVDVRQIEGLTVAELGDKLRWRIDPELLFFRKICGRVVKRDPVTGVEYPVPYATVEVEDTDCSLVGYFPVVSKWGWYFPFACRREVIATVKTDKCGNFCVYVPRWDIDWILKWRRERICFPLIFERPTIAELLDDLIVHERFPPKPGPDPDPSWLMRIDRGQLLSTVERNLGGGTARKLGGVLGRLAFGADTSGLDDLLRSHAFEAPQPPPLPDEIRLLNRRARAAERSGDAADGQALDGVRSTIGSRLKLDAGRLEELDLRRFIGPFRRCVDVFVPEWVAIHDAPDITFRVTQDVNADGIEETIYSEGYFQVRWDAGPLPNVKLVASPIAISIPECGDAIPIPCGNVPEISRVGRFMQVRVDPDLYDPVAGYTLRTNRPHASGRPDEFLPSDAPAEAPFHGVVAIYGCVDVETTATHYRILDSYSADGVSFTPFLPMLGYQWPVSREDATHTSAEYHTVMPDAEGWYPIVIPKGANPNDWEPQNLVLDWNTYRVGDGKHILKIELGAGGEPLEVQPLTTPVAFNIENAAPAINFTVEYRRAGSVPWLPLTFPCPVIRRGSTPQDLEFRITFNASARHLRDVSLGGGGCGGGEIVYESGAPDHWFPNAAGTGIGHWHVDVDDNAAALVARFRLDASALQGTYSFGAWAANRALNPAGGDTGHLASPPYEYDPADVYSVPSYHFSVINSD